MYLPKELKVVRKRASLSWDEFPWDKVKGYFLISDEGAGGTFFAIVEEAYLKDKMAIFRVSQNAKAFFGRTWEPNPSLGSILTNISVSTADIGEDGVISFNLYMLGTVYLCPDDASARKIFDEKLIPIPIG